ncbi:hypothetical protein KO518_13815 [Aestuariibacter sp. A3R04]|nr:hypothetical protein [Aestuariibacter sp. A3R04]
MPAMLQCASPAGSGYNEEWAIKLRAGMVFHGLELETNLKNKDTIKKVSIDIGGTPIVSPSGKILNLIDDLYAKHKADGRLVLNLAKFECRSPQGIYKTALATSIFDDVTLKVEFGSRNTTDADSANHDPAVPTLKAKGYMSENPMANVAGGGRKFLPIQYELTQISAAAGKHDWIFPSGSVNRSLQRLILDESEVSISRVIVKRGAKVIREMTRSDIDFGNSRYADAVSVPGFLLIDFIQFGFGANDAITTEGLNFEFEVDGPGAIRTFVDGFDRIA